MTLPMSFKKAKQGRDTKSNKSISSFALIGIAILAIFSFNNIIDNYTGLGLSSVAAFGVAIVIYLLPFSFIIAEMASIKLRAKSNSGLTNWVNTCIGRKTSFITSYMFWFANLFYFVGAVPTRLNYIAFGFTGADYTLDPTFNFVVPFVAVALFALITFISTLNTKKISKFTSVGAWVVMGLTALFFIVAIAGWITGSVNSSLLPNTEAPGLVPNESLDIWGDSGGINFLWMSTFIWVLMAADGAQSLGVYVNDVRGGQKTFSKSIVIAVLVIGFVYIFGTLLVSVFPPKIDGTGTLANNLVNSYFNMFYFMFQGVFDKIVIQKITYIIIGLSYLFVLGGILIWTSAPVRTFFSEIPTGVFGSSLPKQNRNGSPVKGAWIQFLIVAPLLLIPALGIGQLSDFFGFIKTSSGWIGMIPPLIIFVAYFNLRLKKDGLERGFRMGKRKTGLFISGFMIAVFITILIITFLDVPLDKPVATWPNNWWLNVTYKIVCLIVLVLPIYLWYLRYEKIIRETKIAKNLGLNEKLVLKKYSLSKKVNQFFYMSLVNQKIIKLNSLDEKYNKLFDEINYSDKNNKKHYKLLQKNKRSERKIIISEYNAQIEIINNSLKQNIEELYLKMNDELNKFRLFKIIDNKKQLDIKGYISFRKYRKDFSINVLENQSYEHYEIDDIDTKLATDAIYSSPAIKKSSPYISKNILDKVELQSNEIILYYLVNDEYQEFKFNLKDSSVVFKEDSKHIVRYNGGNQVRLDLVQLISTKDNNVWFEEVFIANSDVFQKHYLDAVKNINLN